MADMCFAFANERVSVARASLVLNHGFPSAGQGTGRFFALVFLLAALLTMPLVTPRQTPRPASPELLSDAALEEVQRAEAAYARSIDRLAAVAGPELERSPSPLAAAYREKLKLLDSDIAELKSAASHNRYNAYLRTELASLYGEKTKTLQEWMNDAKRN